MEVSLSVADDHKVSKIPESTFQCNFPCVQVIRSSTSPINHKRASGDSPRYRRLSCHPNDSAEVQDLKNQINQLQSKYDGLMYEHEKANIDLAHQKHKVMQLERKLQFVKDNQPLLGRLEKAYFNMNAKNQSVERKFVEIRDKSVQTWQGILCRACRDTEKLRCDLNRIKAMYDDCFLIKKGDMNKLESVLHSLKKLSSKEKGIGFSKMDADTDTTSSSNSHQSLDQDNATNICKYVNKEGQESVLHSLTKLSSRQKSGDFNRMDPDTDTTSSSNSHQSLGQDNAISLCKDVNKECQELVLHSLEKLSSKEKKVDFNRMDADSNTTSSSNSHQSLGQDKATNLCKDVNNDCQELFRNRNYDDPKLTLSGSSSLN